MIGDPLLRLEECDSTNRVALDWDEAPHGACVVATSQTSGRGRLGRSWESAAGQGLYVSVVLRDQPAANLGICSLFSALAVGMALEEIAGVRTRIKWPNDILVVPRDGKPCKIGGILCESRGDKLVVGIGVNVGQTADQLPSRPIFPASSLHIETSQEWQVESVLSVVLRRLDEVLALSWTQARFDFRRRCFGLGDVVRVKSGSENQIGIFQDVGENGALLLRTADGLKTIVAGDVDYF